MSAINGRIRPRPDSVSNGIPVRRFCARLFPIINELPVRDARRIGERKVSLFVQGILAAAALLPVNQLNAIVPATWPRCVRAVTLMRTGSSLSIECARARARLEMHFRLRFARENPRELLSLSDSLMSIFQH